MPMGRDAEAGRDAVREVGRRVAEAGRERRTTDEPVAVENSEFTMPQLASELVRMRPDPGRDVEGS